MNGPNAASQSSRVGQSNRQSSPRTLSLRAYVDLKSREVRPVRFGVSIVVPAFREQKNIAELTTRLFEAVKDSRLSAELIIVDDNSCDGTIELCEELAQRYPIRLITRTNERGLATAVICGLREARGEFVVVMDADLSHPPESVEELLAPLRAETADFVIGSRYVEGGSVDESWSLLRHVNSRIASILARGLTQASDPMAGFFAIRQDRLGELSQLNPCGYKIGLEIIVRCGCDRVAEVPIHFEDRKHGESKLNLREQWLYIQHLFRLYAFRFPELLMFCSFGAVGVSGMIVDLAGFRWLIPLTGLAAGRAIAIWLAMTWNFEINRRVTFRKLPRSRWHRQYFGFCASCFFGAAVSWTTALGLMQMSRFFYARPVVAAILASAVAAFVNFSICRRWVFAGRKSQLPSPVLHDANPSPFVAKAKAA